MKKLFFVLIILAALFNGCALKSIKPIFKQDTLYEKTLKYTQRGQIVNSLETKALIDAVYLNPLYPKKFKNPTFLVGIYNEFNNALENEEFSLTLNNEKPIKVTKKIPNFIPYKFYPFYNSWMSYYLVEFNKTKQPYILIYKSKHWGKTKLIF